ncbi:flagellar brake protein [Enterovibrio sp. ZSDZ35]|uniref:Flagellar brake protein n=1 Tax=Enterovibrio qingdaonensis TaxID=2899818 RepID=A0ABT5QRE9_9GAMM|nr:flagellar brake protein [Enterovibrio sp. ZSDZ35]MDD1783149.1 flagellar brake protein [Enterovibrio sp. ZSDZ35]
MQTIKTDASDSFYRLLSVGSRLSIELSDDPKKTQVSSRLVGFRKEQFLLIDCPTGQDPIIERFYIPNNEIIIRAVTDSEFRDVIAFRSLVMGVIHKPIRLLIVSIPENVAHRQIRQEPRIDTNLWITAECGSDTFKAFMLDYSVSGCCLEVNADDRLMFEDETLVLNINKGDDLKGKVAGLVVAVNNEKTPPTVGVRFDETQGTLRKELFYQFLFDLRANDRSLDV